MFRLERARMTSALGGGAACCLDIAMCNWESIINSIKNTEMDADRSTPPQSSATPSSSSVLPSDSVSQVASTPSDSEAPSARRTVKRRKLRATSTWDHFREAEGDEPHAMSGNVLHYCKRCRNPSWSTHISGNARYHLEKSHHIVVQESSTSQDKRQLAIENAFARTTVKRAQDVRKNELNTLRSAINVDAFREAQMLLSARRHLPLSFATWPEYQALLAAVNPAVQELLTESASTVASDLDRAYEAHQESVRRQLGRARSLVHIAMDVWSSPQRKAYIAVHAQWVDEGYSPRKALLGLPNLRRSHAGAAMAPYLMRIIRRYSLAHRIGYFTGDNDTKNDTCLRQLAVDLSQEYGISFDPVSSRTRCAGHIINLSLQAFLFATSEEALQAAMEQAQDEASDVTVADALHDQVHSSTRQTTHGKRKKRNDTAGWRSIGPLGKLHNIAVFIRNSTVRNDAWDDIAGKALGIDNITRWNSWYKLLDAAISQEGPLSILLNQFHNELEADILTHDDWQVLKMTHEFLQPFHQATLEQQMEWASIDQVLENMDILFMQFEDAKVKYADNARMVNSVHMGWWVLAKYYAESDKNPVYATALLLHPEKRRRYLDRHWPEEWRQTAINGARRLWAKYKDRPLASESASRLRNERGEATPYERIKQSMSVLDKTDDEDELEKFVESAPRHTTTKTPLEWWCRDEQRMEYPRLHQMALDIFSVPAMSDDPERVFSCARRTISWDRARLSADTIEELQCLGNWVKNDLIRKLYVAVDDEIIDVAGADDETTTAYESSVVSTESQTLTSTTTVFTATIPSATVTVTRGYTPPAKAKRDASPAPPPPCMTNGVTYSAARITSACACIDVPASTVSVTYTAGTQTVTSTSVVPLTTTATVTEWVTTSTAAVGDAVTVTVDPPTPTNLVPNPGFDRGLDGWSFYTNNPSGWSGGVVGIAGPDGSGTNAMSIYNSQYLGFSTLRTSVPFTLDAGRTYRWSFQTRNSQGRDPAPYIYASVTSDGYGVAGSSATNGQAIGNGWYLYQGTFTVSASLAGPKGAFAIGQSRSTSPITWYFDNAVVIAIS
ncbi:putative AC transposase [Purpureocillium lavendulum]|uniref:AC transposase n=1 Tax=Purpureocillium lavendulum TaxID=1247861 RepID=A0AB34FPG1_9HYPO|nr:putative AC transposase [Purpureocillium lavendulum]